MRLGDHEPEHRAAPAAERWFLRRGLPAVLRPGTLVRRVWPRSAPALAAFAVMMAFSILTVSLTGKHTIDIDGTPTRTEWFLLAVVVLVVPTASVDGLAGVAHGRPPAAQRGVDGVAGGGGAGGRFRRPERADPRRRGRRGRRHRRDTALHRNGTGLDPGVGGPRDDEQPRLGRQPAAAGAAGDAVDRPGVLQRARVDHGVHRQPRALVAGAWPSCSSSRRRSCSPPPWAWSGPSCARRPNGPSTP